jgi:hypothetical protein
METVKMTINLTIEVEVVGNYRKAESGSWYGNGGIGSPPEPAEFEIQQVKWQGQDIAPILDTLDFDFESLENDCIEEIENK